MGVEEQAAATVQSAAADADHGGLTEIASPGIWQSRNWRLFWAGSGVSVMGDFVLNVTVMLWVVKVIAVNQTWAPAAASGVLIAAAVPAVAIGPFCGVFIDRWNRRRTMLAADAARTLVLIAALVPLAFLCRWPGAADRPARPCLRARCSRSVLQPVLRPVTIRDARRDRAQGRSAEGQRVPAVNVLHCRHHRAAAGCSAVRRCRPAVGADHRRAVVRRLLTTIWLMRDTATPAATASETPAGRAGYWREFGAGLRFFATSPVLLAVAIGIFVALLGSGALNTLDSFLHSG